MQDGKTTSDSQNQPTHDYQRDYRTPERSDSQTLLILDEQTPPAPKTYTCGSLTYTLGGIFSLFAWLLWGDFCFQLMENAGPAIIPFKLKDLGASNTTMQVILTILPSILNVTVCPWVSYKSDRHRGRLGRRIPFILYTLPFLTACLILVGWSENITPYVRNLIPALQSTSPKLVSIVLIGIFWTMFAFFNMFVASVFYYFFNDVVPPQFLGRFVSLFNMVGGGAGSFFNFFFFPHAKTHFREILTGVALFYCFGFLMVCFMVREGKYPPPPEHDDSVKLSRLAGLISFFKQSFTTRLYLYIFLFSAFSMMAGSMGMYNNFFNLDMNLSMDQIGHLNAYGGIASLVATYFTAVYIDRWHPLRVAAYTGIFTAVTGFGNWIWIFVRLPGEAYFWLSLANQLIFVFGGTLAGVTVIPLFMRIFPKSLYGQFSSAQAMTRSFGVMIAGFVAGRLVDKLSGYFGGSDYTYHFTFFWRWFWQSAAAACLYLAYRDWKRLGGDESYRPPAPWLPDGFEPVTDKVKSSPSSSRNVMLAIWLGVYGALISLGLSAIFLIFMQRHHLSEAFNWYIYPFLPMKAFLTLISWIQLTGIKRDIQKSARGIPTRLGIPHHGVLMVNAIQALCYFPVFWLQTIWMIETDKQNEIIFFGIANLASMIASTVGLQILRWMERPVTGASATAFELAEEAAAI